MSFALQWQVLMKIQERSLLKKRSACANLFTSHFHLIILLKEGFLLYLTVLCLLASVLCQDGFYDGVPQAASHLQ